MSSLYRPRWPLLLILLAGIGGLIALTYLPSEPSGEARPATGGAYVEGVAGAPSAVNPLFASFNEVDRDLTALVFAGLVQLGPNGAVEPDLAGVPKVTPDGLTYIFELRRGLSWHDGEPLTAADVLFTVSTVQDPGFQGDPVLTELFRDVEATARDERTVIMTLPQPFAPFLARAATVGILPEHLLRGVDADGLADARFNQQPVGSGPFELVELTPQAAVLAPFDGYHFGRPFLEEVELRFYRDDASLFNALRDGEVDGALFRPGLDREEIEFIDGDPQWVRRSLHGTTYTLVYLNQEVPAFQDPLVRQALQLGLDRNELIAEALGGQALPLDSPIVPDLWAYVGSPEAYAFNQAQANLLLEAAGAELDGDVRSQNGLPFRFRLAASDDPLQARVAGEIARQWGELGLAVDVEVSGASRFVEDVLLPRDFHAALVVVDPGPDPDPYPLWHSTQTIGEGRNLAGFASSTADRLLENGRLTTSAAERAAEYRSFQEIFARELPAVLLYTPAYQYVVRAGVQGLSPGLLLTLSARFNDIQGWFMERATDTGDDE